MVNEEEDARLLNRCEAKRKEWPRHRQCDVSVQNVDDKTWKNEELRNFEEALPRLKECHLEKVSGLQKAKTGVGCDGFHTKVPLDVTKETRREIVEFLQKARASGHCSFALHDSLVGSPESAGCDEMAAEGEGRRAWESCSGSGPRMLCGYFDHQRRVEFEECVAEPLKTITAILPGSK